MSVHSHSLEPLDSNEKEPRRCIYSPMELCGAFSSYILSRTKSASFDTDTVNDYLEELATVMGVPLDIRTAKIKVHEVFPPRLASAIERILTGEEWSEAVSTPVRGQAE